MNTLHTVLLGLLLAAPGALAQRYYECTAEADETREKFVVKTSLPDVIEAVDAQLQLPEAERRMFIIGKIDYGNGGHNLDWNWHFVPDEWGLAESAIELCDGRPSMVEAALAYWIDTVGSFCPWGSSVSRETTVTDVIELPESGTGFLLAPNPAAEFTRMGFVLQAEAPVGIRVYNALGRKVLEVPARNYAAGVYNVELSLAGLLPGVYQCMLMVERNVYQGRLVIVR